MKFPEVTYNEGGHFDSTSGLFQCPARGIYIFHFTIRVYFLYSDFWVDLRKEGEILASGVTIDDRVMSNVVFVECLLGENVWVETASGGETLGFHESKTVMFTGALLQEL